MLNAARLSIYKQTLDQLSETHKTSFFATCVSVINLFISMHWTYSATNGALAFFLTLLYGGAVCMQACALYTPRVITNNISKHLLKLHTTITKPTNLATNTPEAKAQTEFCRYVVYNQMHQAFTVAKNRIALAGALGKLLGAAMGTTFSIAYMVAAGDSNNTWAHELLSPASTIETLIFVSSQCFLFPHLFRTMQAEIYDAVCLQLEDAEKNLARHYQNSKIPETFAEIDSACYRRLQCAQKMEWDNFRYLDD